MYEEKLEEEEQTQVQVSWTDSCVHAFQFTEALPSKESDRIYREKWICIYDGCDHERILTFNIRRY